MSVPLRPVALRVGPLSNGAPAIELELFDGRRVFVELDVGQASAISDRLRECVDGRVRLLPQSMRVVVLPLEYTDDSPSVGVAVVPDLGADLQEQGPL